MRRVQAAILGGVTAALAAVIGFGGAAAITATAAEQISAPLAASTGDVVYTPNGTTNAEY